MSWREAAMEKWLCLGSLSVAALMLLIFTLDLFLGIPLGMAAPEGEHPFLEADIFGILASGLARLPGVERLPRRERF